MHRRQLSVKNLRAKREIKYRVTVRSDSMSPTSPGTWGSRSWRWELKTAPLTGGSTTTRATKPLTPLTPSAGGEPTGGHVTFLLGAVLVT